MIILNEPDKFVVGQLGQQLIEKDLEYFKSPYVVQYKNTFFNTLTGEAVLVDDIGKDISYLICSWFYVPKFVDTSSLAHLIRQKRLYSSTGPGSYTKSLYVIFTTTACNAACTYCFEKGYETITMSEETADDVAQYIEKTRDKNQTIRLKWFGGEPLVNKAVIDRICGKLKEDGVKYESSITTNGSLLSKCSDKELIDLWHIKDIQLTFDALGERYETFKSLPKGSYEALIEQVDRLTSLGVYIYLRVHYHPENGLDECFRIVDKFKHLSNVWIYTRIVYDTQTEEYYDNVLKLEDYIEKSTGKELHRFPKLNEIKHCMADNNKMIGITPDGGLTPCEHYAYGEHIFGTIYSEEEDTAIVRNWESREKISNKNCKECPLYPICKKLTMCPAEGKCENGYKYYQIETIKRALRRRAENLNVSSGIRS